MQPSRDVIEYVDGPLSGTTEVRSGLPETIPARDGLYVRSVRCADDRAMRYVWHRSEPAERNSHQPDLVVALGFSRKDHIGPQSFQHHAPEIVPEMHIDNDHVDSGPTLPDRFDESLEFVIFWEIPESRQENHRFATKFRAHGFISVGDERYGRRQKHGALLRKFPCKSRTRLFSIS